MKKKIQKIHHNIKKHLNQEVSALHWFVILLVPALLYLGFSLYAQAMSTTVAKNVPVHTRIVYYDGNFSQNIAFEELETSIYVINQTGESLLVEAYEYLQNNNQNSLSKITVAGNAQTLVNTKKPSLIIVRNQAKNKQSIIMVGRNKFGDEDRAAILKKVILMEVNPNSTTSPSYAALQLSKISKFDASINSICSNIYQNIQELSKNNFTEGFKLQSEQEICGTKSPVSKITPKATTTIGKYLKEVIIKQNDVVEFTMPDGY